MTFDVAVDADLLARAMQARGLNATRLSVAAGVSLQTISRALAGGRVWPSTWRRVVTALADAPVLPELEQLVVASR